MASPQDSRVVHKMGFAPLDPIDVSVGWMNVKLYPKITPSMPVYEQAHAFQVNKAALKDLPTDLRLIIDVFGSQLNASSTVEGILSNWRQFFHKRWMDFCSPHHFVLPQLSGQADGRYHHCKQRPGPFASRQWSPG
jgi:hypothetical protein